MYELVLLKNGTSSIRATAEKETFHPVIGPEAEARALYVDQLKLRDRLQEEGEPFVVWDVGLGGAANIMTVLKETKGSPRSLNIFSFDQTLEPLKFALKNAAALGYFGDYESRVDEVIKLGQCQFQDGLRSVDWTLKVADFPNLLFSPKSESLPKPHAILFDAFSPAKNPDMWTLPLFRRLYKLLDPNRPCLMSTYSRSTMLRVSWLLAGFFVGVGSATGEKEQTTIASNQLSWIENPLDQTWLERATRSTSAEPLHGPEYEQRQLSAVSRVRLFEHAQFGISQPF